MILLVGLVVETIMLSGRHKQFLYFGFFILCLIGQVFHYIKMKRNFASANLPDGYVSSILFSNKFLIGGLSLVVFSFLLDIV